MDKFKFKSIFLHQETNTTRIKIQSFIVPENQHNYNPIWGFFWTQNQHNWSQIWGLFSCTRKPTQLQSSLRVSLLHQGINTITIQFEGFLGGETPTQLESKFRAFLHQKTNTTRIKIQDFFALENPYWLNSNLRYGSSLTHQWTDTKHFSSTFSPSSASHHGALSSAKEIHSASKTKLVLRNFWQGNWAPKPNWCSEISCKETGHQNQIGVQKFLAKNFGTKTKLVFRNFWQRNGYHGRESK